jgi:hypothetical protein
LLPIHWGTFNLALHAWDEPAESLLRLAPAAGAQLLMPRIGEPVEPAHAGKMDTWWRRVDSLPAGAAEPVAAELPPGMPWPLD